MVTIADLTFSPKSKSLNLIQGMASVNKVELSKFADNTAVYAVRHTGSTDELATTLDQFYQEQFEITGLKSGEISMRMK
jgi:hypothetical protein